MRSCHALYEAGYRDALQRIIEAAQGCPATAPAQEKQLAVFVGSASGEQHPVTCWNGIHE
jgi:hypothetical protein